MSRAKNQLVEELQIAGIVCGPVRAGGQLATVPNDKIMMERNNGR